MEKSCKDFIAAYQSKIITCFSCKYWEHDDFICLNPDEVKKRNKENEFDELERQMKSNRPVKGPL